METKNVADENLNLRNTVQIKLFGKANSIPLEPKPDEEIFRQNHLLKLFHT